MELIAERCKRDFTYDLAPDTCPSAKVEGRLEGETWGGRPFDRAAFGPELNAVCLECDGWEPVYGSEKPGRAIANTCDLPFRRGCPDDRVQASFLSGLAFGLDDICAPCRLYTPRRD